MGLLPLLKSESIFALKGGSAINYFYRNMPRFSVDIDLTYLPLKSRQESLEDISVLLNRICHKIQEKEPHVQIISKKSKEANQTFKILVHRNNMTIKFEPNLIIRGSVFGAVTREICDAAKEEFQVSLRQTVLSEADLYGGKICAALDRQHPRDLFDIKILMDNEGLTEKIRKAFIVYLISHNRPINELLRPVFKDIRRTFENEFSGMSRVPIGPEDLETARESLLKAIHEQLTEDEKRFILSVKERRPEWEKHGVNGIEKLSGVQWKLHNLNLMDRKKHARELDKLKRNLDL